jgi:hypothetical protein
MFLKIFKKTFIVGYLFSSRKEKGDKKIQLQKMATKKFGCQINSGS